MGYYAYLCTRESRLPENLCGMASQGKTTEYFDHYDLLQGAVVTELVMVCRLLLVEAERLRHEEDVEGEYIALLQQLLWRLYTRFAQLVAYFPSSRGDEEGEPQGETRDDQIQDAFTLSTRITLMMHLVQTKMQLLGVEEPPEVSRAEEQLVLQAAQGISAAYFSARELIANYDEGNTEHCFRALRHECSAFARSWGITLLNAFPALHALRFIGVMG